MIAVGAVRMLNIDSCFFAGRIALPVVSVWNIESDFLRTLGGLDRSLRGGATWRGGFAAQAKRTFCRLCARSIVVANVNALQFLCGSDRSCGGEQSAKFGLNEMLQRSSIADLVQTALEIIPKRAYGVSSPET